ncbi:MAG: DUF503 domain-containing protein [Defluviitaleaceae bacterium]|nr:DUF503 domain-containing protein [Defluviitaleaceae bacterium]
MYTESAKLTLRMPYVDSLKEKRQIRRSLIDKTRKKFNVAIAEVDTQDVHSVLSIGIAVVSGVASHARDSLETIIRYLEDNTDVDIDFEIY